MSALAILLQALLPNARNIRFQSRRWHSPDYPIEPNSGVCDTLKSADSFKPFRMKFDRARPGRLAVSSVAIWKSRRTVERLIADLAEYAVASHYGLVHEVDNPSMLMRRQATSSV